MGTFGSRNGISARAGSRQVFALLGTGPVVAKDLRTALPRGGFASLPSTVQGGGAIGYGLPAEPAKPPRVPFRVSTPMLLLGAVLLLAWR